MCFYQSYAREVAEANGWKRLATNSAKMVNILGGYGYQPMLASMEDCVEAAVLGPPRDERDSFTRPGTPWAPRCEGTALVAQRWILRPIRPRSPRAVFFRVPQHRLVGQSYVGLILVLDTAKGGVASAWMLREMASRGVVPLAIVLNSVNPILAQGAAFGELTLLAGFDGDVTAQVPDGATVEIDPATRVLRVL